ncbi:hypothetical protein ROJ8625_03858 [Roseivivax jejudonensis]|uniref:Uncharacterized protein n=1 Tax=Roseivivax jejudonensis TaxID=1529041 RepID=A0A1X7A7H6_9RHOB|nr:hypothetical protein [Roseivivax jejudonensis]SLN72624.1 hypothetical protein ROJ8625_03858 [Roseivivax jejudonensis]
MKAMMLAFVATAVITVGAWYTLTHVIEFSAADRAATGDTVRLGDSGPEDE